MKVFNKQVKPIMYKDDSFVERMRMRLEIEETKKDMLSEANHEDIENSIQHQLDIIDGKLARREISTLEHQDLHDNILK